MFLTFNCILFADFNLFKCNFKVTIYGSHSQHAYAYTMYSKVEFLLRVQCQAVCVPNAKSLMCVVCHFIIILLFCDCIQSPSSSSYEGNFFEKNIYFCINMQNNWNSWLRICENNMWKLCPGDVRSYNNNNIWEIIL